MKLLGSVSFSLALGLGSSLAGPFAPGAGQPGSTAVASTSASIRGWANRVANYQVGTDCLPQWQNTRLALGAAGTDATNITCLGAGGQITLTFPGFITNEAGADFAIFENGITDGFLELAYVEVSQDGINFLRFPGQSLTASPVAAFGAVDPTNVSQLGSKYRLGFGEPYDLATLGLAWISHIRLVDIPGDGSLRDSQNRPIYDPFPNSQTAGFDLDGIAALHLSPWLPLSLGTLAGDRVNAACFGHLPDGKFVLGLQGILRQQATWGQAASTVIPAASVEFDPSFVALKDSATAILGTGGNFFSGGGLHKFSTSPAAVTAGTLATVDNYAGAYWKSPASGREGWLVNGLQGPNFAHRISFVSLDGTRVGSLTENLSTYSGGLAVDAAGNVFVAQYELEGTPQAAESDWVRKFSSSQVDAAVAAVLAGSPQPLAKAAGSLVFQFDSASSLAVDGLGRLWASGFKVNQLQAYDPLSGATARLIPALGAMPGVVDVSYQVSAFSRLGRYFLGVLGTDEAGTAGSAVTYGAMPLDAYVLPLTLADWKRFHAVTLNEADPDRDGLNNLTEYALGTSPVAPSAPPWVVTYGQLEFVRDPARVSATVTVEASSSLLSGNWAVLPTTETLQADGKSLVTAREPTGQGRRFLRLRITTP